MEPPVFTAGAPGTVRAAPGSAACLLLHPPAGTPPFTYHWSRGGATLDDRFTVTDDAGGVRLTVSSARTGDSGVYTLQASNAAGSDTSRVRLEVSAEETPTGDDPPTFLRRLQDLTVKVGTRTRFLVEIVSSTECKVTWYRNERRLMEAERVSLARDGNFWCADVAAVSVDDAGRWTCTAENEGGRASCSAHLNVLVPKAYKRPEFVEELRALLTEQGTVSLECKVVGVPTPVLRWFKDSREIKAGDVFALTANADDPTSLGTYTCEAVNCMGRAYSSSKVHVVGRGSREGSTRPSSGSLTPEPPPIFTKELEDHSVKICDSLTLGCHVVVPPWPRSVVWYNKEGKVEPGERYHVLEDGVGGYLLEIPSAEWADEGEWKCVATSSGGRVGISTCHVAMDVPKNYRKPRFMENLQAVLTEEGLVSFECKVVGFPTPVLSWFKDGQELKPGDVYQLTGTNSLGSYCCIARNCMGQASSSAELTVEDIQNQLNEEEKLQLFSKNQAPKFIIGLKSLEAKIDEPFRFSVKVAIPPEPSVLWYRDEQPVDESQRCHLTKEDRGTFSLDIQTLEFLDQAEWKCVAVNDFGHSVTSCFLKLIIPRHYKKPRFLENLQAILSDEGAVNLECKVIGVPQPVLKWYKDGEELKPGDIHRIISGQDGTCCLGTYTCEAQNCMGIAASSASLLGFDDSMKAKTKKAEEQALQRNLSLSTIHEERTSQMYDTPIGDITLDDKGEISFSFDGKEVSVSLYETPDLTEEEALQIVEMYADQLSENVTEHNVVELPPLRFVKETSTSGNLLMEAIIIDVSPDYFASPEEDLRTEADVEDISIADENASPQLSMDQEVYMGGEDYIEKTMALFSDEKSDTPARQSRKKSDSQRSIDDFFSLSRDQSLSEEKKDEDTHLSESDQQSFASARSSAKIKSKSSRPSIVDGQDTSEPTKTIVHKEDVIKPDKEKNTAEPQYILPGQVVETLIHKPKRERRTRRSFRRSSSASEKSISECKEELLRTKADIDLTQIKPTITDVEFIDTMLSVSDLLSKVETDVQLIERDIIHKSELMASAATASRSLEILSSLISPLSELHSIADAAKEPANDMKQISSTIFNNLPAPMKTLHQSLTIIEKCIDMESENKTLVKKTCVAFVEKCGVAVKNIISGFASVVATDYLQVENRIGNEINSLTTEIISILKFSADTIKARNLLSEATEFNLDEPSLEENHLRATQKALFELKHPVNALLDIVESAENGNTIKLAKFKSNNVILNDMSASIQDLQIALEQIETLSIIESKSDMQKYNTKTIDIVVEPVIKLRNAFEQLSSETTTEDNNDVVKQVLNSIKQNLVKVSTEISLIENRVGKFDILQSDNKLVVLQKMAQSLIMLENNLPRLEVIPEVQTKMNAFHKNLTKVLELVIEGNDATKYFTMMEICDAVNRIIATVKDVDKENVMPFASLSNSLLIIQGRFLKNHFDSQLNCSIITNITDILVCLQEAINRAEEISEEVNSEHLQNLMTYLPSTAKATEIITHIDQTIAAIETIKTIETTEDLKILLAPTFENIRPILENLKKYVAHSASHTQQYDGEFIENISDINDTISTETFANPLCELNQNVTGLTQILLENIESLKLHNDIISAIAEPLQELHTTLEILQQDVISQYSDDITTYEVNENVANAVHNLHSCIVIIQEHVGVEVVDEISTLDDISNIKTSADTLPSDHLILPTKGETDAEQIVSSFIEELPISATAQALQSLNNHLTVIQTPELIDTLDTLSEISDYSSLKSVVLGMEDLRIGIESILHPLPIEASENLNSCTNVLNLAVIAKPLHELQESLSVLDTINIPIYEDILDLPTERVHSVIKNICEFKDYLDKCTLAIFSAEDILNNTFEISTKVSTLRQVCQQLKQIIEAARAVSLDVMAPEVLDLEEVLDRLLEVTNVSKGIKIHQIKLITKELFEKILIVQDEILTLTSQSSEKLAQEVKIIQIVEEVESNIAVLQQFDFVDLSRASDISTCVSPQLAQEVESESLVLIKDIVDHAVNIVHNSYQETSTADLVIIDNFIKSFKNKFSLISCLIENITSHAKIIRLLEEFNTLQKIMDDFRTKYFDLGNDVKDDLASFLVHANAFITSLQNSLIKIVDSQSETLFKAPYIKLQCTEILISELKKSKKNTVIGKIINNFLNLVEIADPIMKNIQKDIIEQLIQHSETAVKREEMYLTENIEEFLDMINVLVQSQSTDEESKRISEKLTACFNKHNEYRNASSIGKKLIILKCLSDCVNILREIFSDMKYETVEIDRLENEDTLKVVFTEILQPIQALQSQLVNIQERLLSAAASEDSISFDVTSTEPLVHTMTELQNEIVQQIQSEKSAVGNENISLTMTVDKEIHSIQDSIKSIDNMETAEMVKEITKPMQEIEKSVNNIMLITEEKVQEKDTILTDINCNIGSLESALQCFINLDIDIFNSSMLHKIDLEECVQLAGNLKTLLYISHEELKNSEAVKRKNENIFKLKELLLKFIRIDIDLYLKSRNSSEVDQLRQLFFTAHQLLVELDSTELVETDGKNYKTKVQLTHIMQHIDEYLKLIEIVEAISSVIKIERVMETFEIAKSLKESIEKCVAESQSVQRNLIFTEQAKLLQKLQNALSALQVRLLDYAQEPISAQCTEELARIAQVTAQLQADLEAIVGDQMAVQVPVLVPETTFSLENLETLYKQIAAPEVVARDITEYMVSKIETVTDSIMTPEQVKDTTKALENKSPEAQENTVSENVALEEGEEIETILVSNKKNTDMAANEFVQKYIENEPCEVDSKSSLTQEECETGTVTDVEKPFEKKVVTTAMKIMQEQSAQFIEHIDQYLELIDIVEEICNRTQVENVKDTFEIAREFKEIIANCLTESESEQNDHMFQEIQTQHAASVRKMQNALFCLQIRALDCAQDLVPASSNEVLQRTAQITAQLQADLLAITGIEMTVKAPPLGLSSTNLIEHLEAQSVQEPMPEVIADDIMKCIVLEEVGTSTEGISTDMLETNISERQQAIVTESVALDNETDKLVAESGLSQRTDKSSQLVEHINQYLELIEVVEEISAATKIDGLKETFEIALELKENIAKCVTESESTQSDQILQEIFTEQANSAQKLQNALSTLQVQVLNSVQQLTPNLSTEKLQKLTQVSAQLQADLVIVAGVYMTVQSMLPVSEISGPVEKSQPQTVEIRTQEAILLDISEGTLSEEVEMDDDTITKQDQIAVPSELLQNIEAETQKEITFINVEESDNNVEQPVTDTVLIEEKAENDDIDKTVQQDTETVLPSQGQINTCIAQEEEKMLPTIVLDAARVSPDKDQVLRTAHQLMQEEASQLIEHIDQYLEFIEVDEDISAATKIDGLKETFEFALELKENIAKCVTESESTQSDLILQEILTEQANSAQKLQNALSALQVQVLNSAQQLGPNLSTEKLQKLTQFSAQLQADLVIVAGVHMTVQTMLHVSEISGPVEKSQPQTVEIRTQEVIPVDITDGSLSEEVEMDDDTITKQDQIADPSELLQNIAAETQKEITFINVEASDTNFEQPVADTVLTQENAESGDIVSTVQDTETCLPSQSQLKTCIAEEEENMLPATTLDAARVSPNQDLQVPRSAHQLMQEEVSQLIEHIDEYLELIEVVEETSFATKIHGVKETFEFSLELKENIAKCVTESESTQSGLILQEILTGQANSAQKLQNALSALQVVVLNIVEELAPTLSADKLQKLTQVSTQLQADLITVAGVYMTVQTMLPVTEISTVVEKLQPQTVEIRTQEAIPVDITDGSLPEEVGINDDLITKQDQTTVISDMLENITTETQKEITFINLEASDNNVEQPIADTVLTQENAESGDIVSTVQDTETCLPSQSQLKTCIAAEEEKMLPATMLDATIVSPNQNQVPSTALEEESYQLIEHIDQYLELIEIVEQISAATNIDEVKKSFEFAREIKEIIDKSVTESESNESDLILQGTLTVCANSVQKLQNALSVLQFQVLNSAQDLAAAFSTDTLQKLTQVSARLQADLVTVAGVMPTVHPISDISVPVERFQPQTVEIRTQEAIPVNIAEEEVGIVDDTTTKQDQIAVTSEMLQHIAAETQEEISFINEEALDNEIEQPVADIGLREEKAESDDVIITVQQDTEADFPSESQNNIHLEQEEEKMLPTTMVDAAIVSANEDQVPRTVDEMIKRKIIQEIDQFISKDLLEFVNTLSTVINVEELQKGVMIAKELREIIAAVETNALECVNYSESNEQKAGPTSNLEKNISILVAKLARQLNVAILVLQTETKHIQELELSVHTSIMEKVKEIVQELYFDLNVLINTYTEITKESTTVSLPLIEETKTNIVKDINTLDAHDVQETKLIQNIDQIDKVDDTENIQNLSTQLETSEIKTFTTNNSVVLETSVEKNEQSSVQEEERNKNKVSIIIPLDTVTNSQYLEKVLERIDSTTEQIISTESLQEIDSTDVKLMLSEDNRVSSSLLHSNMAIDVSQPTVLETMTEEKNISPLTLTAMLSLTEDNLDNIVAIKTESVEETAKENRYITDSEQEVTKDFDNCIEKKDTYTDNAISLSSTLDTLSQIPTEQTLVQHIEEFIADEIFETVEEILTPNNIDALKKSISIAKDLRNCLLEIYYSGVIENISPLIIENNQIERANLSQKLQNALSTLHIQALETAQEMSPLIKPKLLQKVSEMITQLQDDLTTTVATKICKVIQPDENNESMKISTTMILLMTLLKDVNRSINLSTSEKRSEYMETVKDTLDEIQIVIIKLKRDYDGAANDTLNETLEDLECSVRSVQLQINEESPPELLKEACETLQLLAKNMSTPHEQNLTFGLPKYQSTALLETCSNESEQTIRSLETASILGPQSESNLSSIMFKLQTLTDSFKSIRQNFMNNADTLIENGVEVIEHLEKLENSIFELEKDIEAEKSLAPKTKDIIVTAVHSVYESISNMRSTITSIQKQYMFENYGEPSQYLLLSIKNINMFLSTNDDGNQPDWKKFTKSIRKVLNHFEDIKFYINLDKTARLPSDATFTKIILEDLINSMCNIMLPIEKRFGTDILKKAKKTMKRVEKNLTTIQQLTLEVKDKIPMFRDIADSVHNLTSSIKIALNDTTEFNNQDLLVNNLLIDSIVMKTPLENIIDSEEPCQTTDIMKSETICILPAANETKIEQLLPYVDLVVKTQVIETENELLESETPSTNYIMNNEISGPSKVGNFCIGEINENSETALLSDINNFKANDNVNSLENLTETLHFEQLDEIATNTPTDVTPPKIAEKYREDRKPNLENEYLNQFDKSESTQSNEQSHTVKETGELVIKNKETPSTHVTEYQTQQTDKIAEIIPICEKNEIRCSMVSENDTTVKQNQPKVFENADLRKINLEENICQKIEETQVLPEEEHEGDRTKEKLSKTEITEVVSHTNEYDQKSKSSITEHVELIGIHQSTTTIDEREALQINKELHNLEVETSQLAENKENIVSLLQQTNKTISTKVMINQDKENLHKTKEVDSKSEKAQEFNKLDIKAESLTVETQVKPSETFDSMDEFKKSKTRNDDKMGEKVNESVNLNKKPEEKQSEKEDSFKTEMVSSEKEIHQKMEIRNNQSLAQTNEEIVENKPTEKDKRDEQECDSKIMDFIFTNSEIIEEVDILGSHQKKDSRATLEEQNENENKETTDKAVDVKKSVIINKKTKPKQKQEKINIEQDEKKEGNSDQDKEVKIMAGNKKLKQPIEKSDKNCKSEERLETIVKKQKDVENIATDEDQDVNQCKEEEKIILVTDATEIKYANLVEMSNEEKKSEINNFEEEQHQNIDYVEQKMVQTEYKNNFQQERKPTKHQQEKEQPDMPVQLNQKAEQREIKCENNIQKKVSKVIDLELVSEIDESRQKRAHISEMHKHDLDKNTLCEKNEIEVIKDNVSNRECIHKQENLKIKLEKDMLNQEEYKAKENLVKEEVLNTSNKNNSDKSQIDEKKANMPEHKASLKEREKFEVRQQQIENVVNEMKIDEDNLTTTKEEFKQTQDKNLAVAANQEALDIKDEAEIKQIDKRKTEISKKMNNMSNKELESNVKIDNPQEERNKLDQKKSEERSEEKPNDSQINLKEKTKEEQQKISQAENCNKESINLDVTKSETKSICKENTESIEKTSSFKKQDTENEFTNENNVLKIVEEDNEKLQLKNKISSKLEVENDITEKIAIAKPEKKIRKKTKTFRKEKNVKEDGNNDDQNIPITTQNENHKLSKKSDAGKENNDEQLHDIELNNSKKPQTNKKKYTEIDKTNIEEESEIKINDIFFTEPEVKTEITHLKKNSEFIKLNELEDKITNKGGRLVSKDNNERPLYKKENEEEIFTFKEEEPKESTERLMRDNKIVNTLEIRKIEKNRIQKGDTIINKEITHPKEGILESIHVPDIDMCRGNSNLEEQYFVNKFKCSSDSKTNLDLTKPGDNKNLLEPFSAVKKKQNFTNPSEGYQTDKGDATHHKSNLLCHDSTGSSQFSLRSHEQHYIKEYQYEPSLTKTGYEHKELPRFVDHNHRDYTLEFARPSGYREKSFEVDRFAETQSKYDHVGRNANIHKAQTLVLDAQLRFSVSPYPETTKSSEPRQQNRQRSRALSEARSIVSEKKSSVSRDSKRKPVFSTYLTDRTAVEGSRVKLTCSVLSSNDPIITWYKNGILLDNKLKYRTKFIDGLITLEVLNAVPTDTAEYSCTVENDNGSVNSSANLKVYPSFEASPIPPTFTRSIRDTYHLAENELVLECRIRGQPLPTITWLKDDSPINSKNRFQAYYLADGVCRLAIESPTREDSGKYTCKAENSAWSDQITHIVNFTGKECRLSPNLATIEKSRFNRQAMESRRPHFTNVLNDYKVAKGGTIGLQVEIKGAPTSVEWLREGRSVTEEHKNARTFVEQGLYTLALPDVTEKESGMYTCRAWSAHGNVDMNAAITVVQPNELEGKPAIIVGRPEKDILISVGEDVNISFRAQGEPKPKVVFMKGIRDITTSQRVCKMTSDDYVKFTLKRSVVSDAGTYCILARNAYGCDRAFVTVVVRQRASSDQLISDWTYPVDDGSMTVAERNYKSVPERIPGEPSVVDGGSNWVSLVWPKPDPGVAAPVLAFKIESWLLGKEGGARWVELGITPLNSFDAFNLRQGQEYHFRVTPRNRYGWGESVQTSTPVAVGLAGDRPEFVDILPGQLKVLANETAILSCRVKGKPTPEVVWMKNGHEVEEEEGRVTTSYNGFTCSLTIKNICIEDEARYSCEATNIHGRTSNYARLAVVTDRMIWEADAKLKRERSTDVEGDFPPQFTMRLRDRRVQTTYPVRLTCQIVGSPSPTVTWFKDGEQIKPDNRRSTSQDEHFHTLEIAPTTLEDGGVYEVMARNNSGAVSCRCCLVVDKGIRAYVAPEFCCGLEPLYRLCDGEELRITAVVEAYPTVGVTWYRDGIRLRTSRRAVMTLDHDGQIELALAAVTSRDEGVYTCTASNEVGRASTSGKLEVVGGQADVKRPPQVVLTSDVPYSKEPMFIRKPRSCEAREGDTVIFECEVVGDPKPDVYWLRDFLKPDYYRDATHFRRVGLGPEYRFEIPHAKLDYTGAYSVVARNTHGETKAIISLQILAKDPSSPEDAHNIRYGEVQVLPRFDKELTDLLSCDGDAVEFECRVSGQPEPDIRWFHYHELIRDCDDFESTFEDGTARLKIKQVTADDEGNYTCEASNCLGKSVSSACLVVYPPGEPNTLSQRLRRPPALLSAASTPRSTPRTTPARSVSRARTPGPDRRLCSPARQMAPTFYTYPFNKVAEEGDTITLQCAVKGLPAPWATWDKDGVIITPSARITIKEKDEILRILEIEQVTIEDVGVYRITVENEFGRAEASARLEVMTQKGKFYGGVRAFSPSPHRSLTYRSRRPSTPRQD